MAGRFDTRMRKPPVRISRAQAARQQAILTSSDTARTAMGAGGFGSREARNGSVNLALQIRKGNQPVSTGAIPVGRTFRKRGYPPIPVATAKAFGP